MAEIVFSVPGRAPAAGSPNARVNWRVRHSDGARYGETVQLIAQSAAREWGNWEKAEVTLTQYAVRLRDHDNFAASFKPGLDAIVKAGIILDDKPSVIDLVLRAVRVKKVADERVEVRIVQR